MAASLRVAMFLGARSLTRGNRGVLALTLTLMALIYAQLLFIPSLIEGATEHIEAELRENLTSNIAVTPDGSELAISDPEPLVEAARATPGVAAATATVLAGTQVSAGSRTSSWSVLAVDPTSYAETFAIPEDMIEGEFLGPDATDEIVLGLGIAGADRVDEATYRTSLQGVHVGDEVVVTLLGGETHTFTVGGIYDSDLAQANTLAFVSRSTSTALVPPLEGKASAVYVRTEGLGDEDAVIEQLRDVRPDLRYESWEALQTTVKDLTGSFDVIKSILNAVSLFVAAITVFIVTYVDLVNKRRTIGIERAVGITGVAIATSYLIRAVALALLGVALGAALFFGVLDPLVESHPFDFPIGEVTLSTTGSALRRNAAALLGVAVVGALVPGVRAVRIRILDAIWG